VVTFYGWYNASNKGKKNQFWAMHRQVELEPDPPRNLKKELGTVGLELGRIASGTGL
jgi:hypothetical protein